MTGGQVCERIRPGFIDGWSEEQILRRHRQRLAGVERAVVVLVEIDGDSRKPAFAGIANAGFIFIVEDRAVNFAIGALVVSKVDLKNVGPVGNVDEDLGPYLARLE